MKPEETEKILHNLPTIGQYFQTAMATPKKGLAIPVKQTADGFKGVEWIEEAVTT